MVGAGNQARQRGRQNQELGPKTSSLDPTEVCKAGRGSSAHICNPKAPTEFKSQKPYKAGYGNMYPTFLCYYYKLGDGVRIPGVQWPLSAVYTLEQQQQLQTLSQTEGDKD